LISLKVCAGSISNSITHTKLAGAELS
jgi:hypothetical protein